MEQQLEIILSLEWFEMAMQSLQEDLKWNEIKSAIASFSLPDVSGMNDELCWKVTLSGEFIISAAVNKIRTRGEKVQWSKYIWNAFLHPSIASNVWKLIQGLYIDDTKMVKNGYDMVSRCCICEEDEDSMSHLLWECFTLKELWFQKNKIFFEEIKPDISKFKCKLLKTIAEHSIRIKGSKLNQEYDNQIISFFKLGPRISKYQSIIACQWNEPEFEFTMFCCDGASLGNPGAVGFGIVIRNHSTQVFGAITGGLGIATNYIAEVYAVVNAAELVVDWKLQNIIIKSYSKTVSDQFEQDQIPWFVRTRWRNATKRISVIRLAHSFREINFSADCAAKKGASLQAGERNIYSVDLFAAEDSNIGARPDALKWDVMLSVAVMIAVTWSCSEYGSRLNADELRRRATYSEAVIG
ncbi:uncharacterized protein LOC113279425 [Papaver somniferum]|uniref:uncharacterized protein LOC113279425 n=1 Tax=Papaver somniferum TaxID=3469 RepID=UPI000E70073A|nr:uncharacterized protein LOC113279425 [Papaver somniferum]